MTIIYTCLHGFICLPLYYRDFIMANSCARGLGAYGATVLPDGSKSSNDVLDFDSLDL